MSQRVRLASKTWCCLHWTVIVNFKLMVDESGKHVIIVTNLIQHNLGNFLSLPEQPKVFIISVKK